jgi:hypothetical protein
MSNPSLAFRPSGSIEFEQVAFEATPPAAAPAPAAPADDGIDRDALSINFGRAKDHKSASTERMLAGYAIDWLIAFPANARPKSLCDRFPWVANRLASQWKNASDSAASVQALLADARWGSAGFPVQVQGELKQLAAAIDAKR